MAILENRLTLSLSDLENYLGANKLPRLVTLEEEMFSKGTDEIAQHVVANPEIRTIFVSGPTSSGKTTFADRLGASLSRSGKNYLRLSLDDYYTVEHLLFDKDGRPDYESLQTIDTELVSQNIHALLAGEPTLLPVFNFQSRSRIKTANDNFVQLAKGDLLLVEGLHGLSPRISGNLARNLWVGIFIMPWGEIVSDRRLIDGKTIRLLRRIARDVRHRGAHAIATLDYWPMVLGSEQAYFPDYLEEANFYVNSMLRYESLVTAPLALADIQSSLTLYDQGKLPDSVFLQHFEPYKAYANLPEALQMAHNLVRDLGRIPVAPKGIVPPHSILTEFL